MTGNRLQNLIVTGGIDLVGEPLDRVDGRAKVTGQARYAAEHPLANLVHAVAITSTIARGHITNIDTSAAEKLPNVLAVITRKNAPTIKAVSREKKMTGQPGQTLAPLQDDDIHFAGQYVGIVIAETLAVAEHAATLVRFRYADEKPAIDPEHPIGDLVVPKKIGRGEPPDASRGKPDSALSTAPIKMQQTYTTPIESHNPMEMHATIAVWAGDHLTLYDSTQHVLGVRAFTAAFLGLSQEKIRVISPFLGGGFGCKGSIWPHTALAAAAAQTVNRPVKLMLTRKQMFTQVGHRPHTLQKISLGADSNGKLLSISHDTISETSDFDEWPEPSGKQTNFLYSCPNVRVTHRMARLNTGTPCQMRAPGEASGTYAIESAMDELAYAVGIDPVELRLRNYSEKDEGEDKPYSSKALRECYQLGSERFGWSKRTQSPRSMRDGNTLIGWGMATATYPTNVSASSAGVRLFPDGRALVTAAAHDLGTGTYTIMTQIAAETLGLLPDKVEFKLGDTIYPDAPVAGGSQTAASVGSAVQAACKATVEKLAHMAVKDSASPLHGHDESQVVLVIDRLQLKDDPRTFDPLENFFRRNANRPIEVTNKTEPTSESKKYSSHAWGAQFAEVRVDEMLGQIRVSRFVGAFAAGRILNIKTARSQVMGAIVMGIGMALHEHTVYDPLRATVVTDNLADYLLPVNPDIPPIECFFVNEVDPHVNTIGAKGIGELGITGTAAAIANAVYHATGKRIRDLPITLDKLL